MFVLSKSYGLDGPKWSAKEIANSFTDTMEYPHTLEISELKRASSQ